MPEGIPVTGEPASPQAGQALRHGREALARGQWQRAREAFEHALQEVRSAEALTGLGWALFWLDQAEQSFQVREEAYRLYLQRGDHRAAARLATFLGVDYADFGGLAVTAGWLQRARRLLEEVPESEEHGWLYFWEGHIVRIAQHDLPRAKELAAQAVAIGRKFGVADLELLALALEGLILVTEGDVNAGMRKLDEATAAALAGEMSDIDSVASTCCLLVHACERVHDYDRAIQWHERTRRYAERWSIGSLLTLCHVEYAAVLIGLGRWQQAERELEEAARTLQAKRPLLVACATVQLGDLRRRQGRWDEARTIFRNHQDVTLAILGLAFLDLAVGDHEPAIRWLERFRRHELEEKWIERVWGMQMLVEAYAGLGRLDEAQQTLQELEKTANRVGTEPLRAVARASRGIFSLAKGQSDQARVCLEDAVDLFERVKAPFEAACTRLRLAGVFDHLGRHSFAIQETRAALGSFARLGAERHRDQASELLARLSPTTKKQTALPLTKRQTEVLRLIARG